MTVVLDRLYGAAHALQAAVGPYLSSLLAPLTGSPEALPEASAGPVDCEVDCETEQAKRAAEVALHRALDNSRRSITGQLRLAIDSQHKEAINDPYLRGHFAESCFNESWHMQFTKDMEIIHYGCEAEQTHIPFPFLQFVDKRVWRAEATTRDVEAWGASHLEASADAVEFAGMFKGWVKDRPAAILGAMYSIYASPLMSGSANERVVGKCFADLHPDKATEPGKGAEMFHFTELLKEFSSTMRYKMEWYRKLDALPAELRMPFEEQAQFTDDVIHGATTAFDYLLRSVNNSKPKIGPAPAPEAPMFANVYVNNGSVRAG